MKRAAESSHLRDTSFALLAGLLFGALFIAGLRFVGLGEADRNSQLIFFRIAAVGEPLGLIVLFVFALCVLFLGTRDAMQANPEPSSASEMGRAAKQVLVVSVLLSVVTSATLAYLVDPSISFSMDEFVANAQARAFLKGNRLLELPDVWRQFSDAIRPVFLLSTLDAKAWVSGYLPGHSLMLVPFASLGLAWLLNPLLNGLTLVCLYGVARQRWPQERERHLVAVGTLAFSSQFIVTGASGYSMTAHLACNVAWLLAMGAKGKKQLFAGPIGFLASTLHQPVPHALFAAPFLLRALRQRQWTLVFWLSFWYVGALVVLLQWSASMSGRLPMWGAEGVFWFPNSANAVTLLLHVLLLITWQTPVVSLALIYTLQNARRTSSFDRDLGAGIVFCLSFYLFFRLVTQGHGWGWRYGHQFLASIALLTASAWPSLKSALGNRLMKQIAIVSALFTLLFQFPARAWQMNHFAAPFARAHYWLRALPADVVLIPSDSIWYGRDLIRNEPPFLAPVLMHSSLAPSESALRKTLGAGIRIRRVSVRELEELGLERVPARSHDR